MIGYTSKSGKIVETPPKRVPFAGGVNKAVERALLTGGFSDKNNLRDMHPGFKSRMGQARLHTTTDSAQEIFSVFQQVDKAGNHNFYAQRADGAVYKATNAPPTATTGNFGTEVLAVLASTKVASASIIDDYLIYSDGKRGHQVYAGAGQMIKGFHVYKGSATIPIIPEIGEDYTNEVTDSDTSRVAVLNSLNTLAAFNAIYVCTEVPANSLTITMVNLNSIASVLAGQYWKSDGTWASMAGMSDGTSATGGLTLGKSGTITWTHPSDEIPHFQFGRTGYWYRFNVSVQLDATVSIAQVVYTGDWKPMENVWDGGLVPIAEAQTYKALSLKYQSYSYNAINIAGLFNNVNDYAYFGSLEKLCGIYIFVSNTPNIIKAVSVGSSDISFVDGGTSDDYISWQQARFDIDGFEQGQSIVITGTTSNNATRKAKVVAYNKIYVETGTLVAEANTSATLTYDNTVANTMTLEFWNGASWVAVSNFNDDSTVASKSGFVTFARTTSAQKTQFNKSPFYAYWYRFKFSKPASRFAQISIEGMPYFDITKFGNGFCNTTWQNRPVLSFDKYGNYIYIGASGRVNCINGIDYIPYSVSDDGRANKTLAMTPFARNLIVWQEEKGAWGGSTVIFRGDSPENFGRCVISGNIGIVNSKAYVSMDGVPASQDIPCDTNKSHTKIVFFISRKGVYATDGVDAVCISKPVGIYFDPTDTTNCIRDGYEEKHWMKYDSAYKCLRVGLCTGTSATIANTFLVYNILDAAWGTDTLGQAITCMTEIEAGSGNITILQMGGGSDGFVYRMNTGLNDVGAETVPVNAFLTLEIGGGGKKIDAKTLQIRCKAQATGSITPSVAFDGNTTYTTETVRSMIAKTVGDSYVYNDFMINRKMVDHISIKLAHNTVSEELYLLDMALLDAEGKNVFKS